jgi:hypothetical protein
MYNMQFIATYHIWPQNIFQEPPMDIYGETTNVNTPWLDVSAAICNAIGVYDNQHQCLILVKFWPPFWGFIYHNKTYNNKSITYKVYISFELETLLLIVVFLIPNLYFNPTSLLLASQVSFTVCNCKWRVVVWLITRGQVIHNNLPHLGEILSLQIWSLRGRRR